jgi:hypothetical protein
MSRQIHVTALGSVNFDLGPLEKLYIPGVGVNLCQGRSADFYNIYIIGFLGPSHLSVTAIWDGPNFRHALRYTDSPTGGQKLVRARDGHSGGLESGITSTEKGNFKSLNIRITYTHLG